MTQNPAIATPPESAARQRWMSVLACARPNEVEARWHAVEALVTRYERLRGPETGMVMTRGRAGGTGDRFNVGEMTVTRCSVRLASGVVGHAYVAGRDLEHAERAAVLDALLQDAECSGNGLGKRIEDQVIAPLAEARAERKAAVRRKAAETRVEFFTLVRGEDS